MRPLFAFILALSSSFFLPGASAEFEKEFEGHAGTFVLLDAQTGKTAIHNPERAKERFSPCSTFKIPNTLIALESKVITDPNAKVKWDKEKYPEKTLFIPLWAKDMSMKDAFKLSCVWFYKEIAEKTGEKRMKEFLKEFHYGNEDISGGLTNFWLMSSLKISALEQIDFLRALHERKFKLSPATYDTAENQVFIEEKTDAYTLRAKTGTGPVNDKLYRGWYVGYVTKGDKVWYFALNMDLAGMGEDQRTLRKNITLSILKNKGIID